MKPDLLDAHVGEKLVALEIHSGCSPCLEAIVPADVDLTTLAQRIQSKFHSILAAELGGCCMWIGSLEVLLNPRSGIIKTREERAADKAKIFARIQEIEIDTGLDESIDNNPDNGRSGWWFIDGLRHHAHVRASSAREAYDKALKSKLIGDWEVLGTPVFLAEELPDVF